MKRSLAPVLALLVLAGATGCATNLAVLQTAETLEPGQIRVSAGGGAQVPVGSLQDAQVLSDRYADDLAAARAGTGELPDEAAQREILRVAASLVVFPPEPVAEGTVRLGLAEGLDAGFEWSSSAWRGDLKWRLTSRDSNPTLALLVGAEVYTFDVDLFRIDQRLEDAVTPLFQYVELQDPRRYDAEAMLLGSVDVFEVLKIYGGARYRAGKYHLPVQLHVDLDNGDTFRASDTLDGILHFAGGTVGLSVGAPFLRVYAEFTGGWSWARTEVLGESEELGGPTGYPAAGLALSF